MHNIWRVLKLIPEYQRRILTVFAITTALSIFGLALPILLGQIINSIVEAATHQSDLAATVRQLTILLAAIGLIRLIIILFDYLRARSSDLLWLEMSNALRKRIYTQLETLSIDFFERNKVGEIMQRTSSVYEITSWVYNLTQGVLANILQNIAILAFLLYKAPIISLILVIVGPLFLWNAIQRTQHTKPIRREWRQQIEQAMGKMNQSISLATSIRSLSAEAPLKQEFDDLIDGWYTGRLKEYRVQWRANAMRGLINLVGILLPLIYVCYGAIKGQFAAGDVFLIITLTQMFLSGLYPIAYTIVDTGNVETAAERIILLLDEQPTIVDTETAIDLKSIETIEFKNVSFRYPEAKRPILEKINFKLDFGQTIALVGPSGSGKSTITKLILRYYEPTEGEIFINGLPIASYTQHSIRRHLGVVMQDVALFNDTIEANLRLAKSKATLKQLKEAAVIARADIFIEKLPEKYKTLVGERGIKLSGGEKQRIAIARAILRDPDLVILDEATSALDSESEQFVQAGLHKLMEGKTAIIIAHRLSTIMQADQILVLKDGRIVERGDHTQLANRRSGLYSRLYRLQTEGAIS